MTCSHYAPTGQRCAVTRLHLADKCRREAAGQLVTPKGKAGYYCREHGELVAAEYRDKLGWDWRFEIESAPECSPVGAGNDKVLDAAIEVATSAPGGRS